MHIIVTRIPASKGDSYRLDKHRHDGTLVTFYGPKGFGTDLHYRQAGSFLGVEVADLARAIASLTGDRFDTRIELDAQPMPESQYRRRGERQSTARAEFPTFLGCLNNVIAEHSPNDLITWTGKHYTCCLDIDFPVENGEPTRPDWNSLDAIVRTLRPQPVAYWPSRRRGLHLIYQTSDGYAAEDLAAAGAMQFLQHHPQVRCELLQTTRVPPEAGAAVIVENPSNDMQRLRELLFSVALADYEAWLDQRGMVIGMRYDHTHCPLAPDDKGKDNVGVVVHEWGIDCNHCQKRYPAETFVNTGSRTSSQISNCVSNLTHWGHAKYVVAKSVPETIAHQVYSALLRIKHGVDDPRIASVFACGEPLGIVRHEGYWTDNHGKSLKLTCDSAILRSLPATQKLDGGCNPTASPIVIDWFTQVSDLTAWGYPALSPLNGIQFTRNQPPDLNIIHHVRQIEELTINSNQNRRPLYIPTAERDMDKAWFLLENGFPGVDKTLLRILLAGRGCIERPTGVYPMLFITGTTGSGKTSHCYLAASIAGDMIPPNILLSRNLDWFMGGLLGIRAECGFILFDEFLKLARTIGMTEEGALQLLLLFAPTTKVHKLNVGMVKLGSLPFFIWSDVDIPPEVRNNQQIARRMHHYRLTGTKRWVQSAGEQGIRSFSKMRLECDEQLLYAFNCILSDVMDDYFGADKPMVDFETICNSLGVPNIMNEVQESGIDDVALYLREFYNALKNAPIKTDEKTYSHKQGWRCCTFDSAEPLFKAYQDCQKKHEIGTINCNMLSETDFYLKIGIDGQWDRKELKGKRFWMRLKGAYDAESGNYPDLPDARQAGG